MGAVKLAGLDTASRRGENPAAEVAMAQEFDKSSKWLLQQEGRAILRLAGQTDVVSCRALQAEVVQPRRLPDGLLEAWRAGKKTPSLYLVEIATYPEKRVVEQAADDRMFVLQSRRILPELVVLVLGEKGSYRVPSTVTLQSQEKFASATFTWTVIGPWTLSAEELLAAPDVGLVPWVPLMSFEGDPEPLLRRCRDRIDREGGPTQANLLAVTQVLTRLRFPHVGTLDILGGRQAMIDSPLLREYAAEIRQEDILRVLRARFEAVPTEVEAAVRLVTTTGEIDRLVDLAASCQNLEKFVEGLAAVPVKRKPSTQGKRRKT